MATSAAAGDRLDRSTTVALVAMALSVFVVANDFVSLSVALPKIESEFDSSVSTVQWVINGYALVFGVMIVTGGRLADLFGRRRLYFIGAAIFAAFSLLAGLAWNEYALIGFRSLMAVGGAIMWPASLGMTFSILPKAKKGLAGGIIIASAGLGNAAGPLIGGVLTDVASWRWVLFLNLPIALVACLVIARTVPESRGDDPDRRIDYAGIAALSIGIVALLLALDEAPDLGWGDWRVVVMLSVSAVALAAFLPIERRVGSAALVPGDVIENRDFRMACLAVLLMSPTFFAVLLYLPQFLQKLLGWSPLEAGLGFLPVMVPFAVISYFAGRAYERLGAKPIITAGAAGLFVGMLLFALIQPDSGYLALLPGMVVFGLGVGLFYSTATTAGVTSLPEARGSLAGAIMYMLQVAGGSIGLGLTTTIFISVSTNHVASDAAAQGIPTSGEDVDAIQGVLAGTESAEEVLSSFPADVADRLIEIVRDAFVAGMQWGFRVDAALALGGFLVALLFVGGRLHLRGRKARA